MWHVLWRLPTVDFAEDRDMKLAIFDSEYVLSGWLIHMVYIWCGDCVFSFIWSGLCCGCWAPSPGIRYIPENRAQHPCNLLSKSCGFEPLVNFVLLSLSLPTLTSVCYIPLMIKYHIFAAEINGRREILWGRVLYLYNFEPCALIPILLILNTNGQTSTNFRY